MSVEERAGKMPSGAGGTPTLPGTRGLGFGPLTRGVLGEMANPAKPKLPVNRMAGIGGRSMVLESPIEFATPSHASNLFGAAWTGRTVVADQAARLALTSAGRLNGQLVEQTTPPQLFVLVDVTLLGTGSAVNAFQPLLTAGPPGEDGEDAASINARGVAYVEQDGDDETAELGNRAKPYGTAQAAFEAVLLYYQTDAVVGMVRFGVGDWSSPTPAIAITEELPFDALQILGAGSAVTKLGAITVTAPGVAVSVTSDKSVLFLEINGSSGLDGSDPGEDRNGFSGLAAGSVTLHDVCALVVTTGKGGNGSDGLPGPNASGPEDEDENGQEGGNGGDAGDGGALVLYGFCQIETIGLGAAGNIGHGQEGGHANGAGMEGTHGADGIAGVAGTISSLGVLVGANFRIPSGVGDGLLKVASGQVSSIAGSGLNGLAGGSGFVRFVGPATTTRTFLLPDASATILTNASNVQAYQGGTGFSAYSVGDMLVATASNSLGQLKAVATGNALISNGVGVVPTWGKITSAHTTGLAVTGSAQTFTGVQSFTSGPILTSAASTGLQLYNTSDQTTNFERLEALWSSNILQLTTRVAGTGVTRALQLGSIAGNSGYAFLTILRAGTPNFNFTNSTVGFTKFCEFAPAANTATSSTVSVVSIAPVYNQVSSTAANTDLLINRTETSVGSGAQLLLDCQVGGSSRFKVSSTGAVTIGNGGTAISKSSVFSLAVSASISAGAVSSQDITATGIVAGDTVSQVEMSAIQPDEIIIKSVRCGTDKITVDFYNTSATAARSLTGTIKVRSFKA